jgi:hypothetical protein
MPAPVYDTGCQAGSQSNVQGSGGANNTNTFTLQNASATGGSFELTGGLYLLECVAINYGSVTLQKLGPDATTWLTAATAFTANGTETASLTRGTYRWAVATSTGVYTQLGRCPQA